jgi:anti-anti-sigma factor
MAQVPGHGIDTPQTPRGNAIPLSCFWLGAPASTRRLMLIGELDLVTADHAHAVMRHAQDHTRALVCDLGDVWFVDVAGLRVLLDAADRARRTGDRLEICNCPPVVPRMLALLGLEDALEIRMARRPAARRGPYPRRTG